MNTPASAEGFQWAKQNNQLRFSFHRSEPGYPKSIVEQENS
tara:strand:+ start:468 stop:590 length:123 start_codon:yes stop_codon:yes gene_type:complete